MNRRQKVIAFMTALVLLTAGISCPAAKKVSAGKPKPKSTNVKLGSIGTSQLPGEWCYFGKTYTLGKDNAINLTLKSAEYTIGRVKVGNRVFRPEEGKKLLVLHYTLHNPLPREHPLHYSTIEWTAVDAKDQNNKQEYLGVGVENTGASLDQPMKPAQKIQVYAVIIVPAQGEVPKLMAANHEDSKMPVARYDLRGKVKPLDPPYADPKDKTGATVASEIPGVIGTSYITGIFDTKVENVEFATPPLRDEGYDKDNVYALITIEYKYCGEGSSGIGGSGAPTSGMELKDADGQSSKPMHGFMMPLTSYRRLEPALKEGESIKVRQAFSVAKGVALKTLTLKEFTGYPVIIDLSGQKTPQ